MPIETPWIYFDGNAITKLWDWYTEVHPVAIPTTPEARVRFSTQCSLTIQWMRSSPTRSVMPTQSTLCS